MKKGLILASILFFTAIFASAQGGDGLLFYLSADNGASADFAMGDPDPNFLGNVSVIDDGAAGKGLHCANRQLLSWKAPGNIYSRRGTLSFWWRGAEPFYETEFPIFRVSFADHTSWDMVWLRIDWNGHGFDAFVTDNNLARIRVSADTPVPDPQKWMKFDFSWDENKGIRLCIDGKEVARRDTTMVLDTGLDQFGPHSRIISPYQVQSAYNMQRGGDIDEIRIYDHMLTEEEAASDERQWMKWYGFDSKTPPPYLENGHTAVRKIGINEIYDLKRWYWKAGDGIRETTWPGVYNRSNIEGRNDYFQLPDWDCYSTSGRQVRFNMPEEPWNYVQVTGGAYGELGISPDNGGSGSRTFARKEKGTQRSFHLLAQPVTGKTVTFTNDVQETPMQEFDAFYIYNGDAPKGVATLSYVLDDFDDYDNPELLEAEAFIKGRFYPDERQMLLARPAQGKAVDAKSEKVSAAKGKPIVHIVIPSDFRDIDIKKKLTVESQQEELEEFAISWNFNIRPYSWVKMNGGLDGIKIELPALDVKPQTADGLFPMNIQVKDPVWKLRDMMDFSFSVKPGEARTLWLDLRDRILPDDKPIYMTVAGSGDDFNADMLKGMKVELVFKDRKEAEAEHIEDRFTQVRDCYAMICEESTSSRKLDKYNQFEADINDLLKVDPDNALGRRYWQIYNSEQRAVDYTEPEVPKGIPEWAFLQTELLKKYRELFEWYIDNRQIETGEFGGGISDDTDLTNYFPGIFALGDKPEKFSASLHRFLGAIDSNGTLDGGMSRIQTDGLHTYEEGVNTICQINVVDQDNPDLISRLRESAMAVRDKLLGVNEAGHLHFRSDYFSSTKIAEKGPWVWSSNREYFHTGPALLLGEYYDDPEAREYILRFADDILAHAKVGADGGVLLPAEINFLTDEVRSWGRNFSMPMMWYAWRWTGDDKYLKAVKSSGWLSKELSEEQFAAQARRVLRAIDSRWYIMTEGSVWTDRLNFSSDLVQESRMGGICMNRSEHLVPANLVSWKFDGETDAETLGIMFSNASPEKFDVKFWNTGKGVLKATMRGELAFKGTWELGTPDGKTRTLEFGRGSEIVLRIPARKDYRISMRLISREE